MRQFSIFSVTALAAFVMAQPVLAYSLSPPKTTSTLEGMLTFVPSEGAQTFTCEVRFTLRTHGPKHAEISGEKIKGNSYCQSIEFVKTPWPVIPFSKMGGNIYRAGWSIGFEACGGTIEAFTDNAKGIWTLGPACLSGTMSSNPPITIVP